VEVLSPSIEKSDRIDKLRRYQGCPTIQEIVLVNQYAPHIEVYRREEEKSPHWHHVVYEPEEALVLESVDIQIPMQEIYQGIDFDEPLREG
jgi:Uma2 family endonuclease